MKKKKVSKILFILTIFTFNLVVSSLYTVFFNEKQLQIDSQRTDSCISSKIYSWDSQITRVVGSNPLSIAIGDVNNDGVLDLVTANNDSGTITILLWNVTQGDWDIQNKSAGNTPCDVAIGDANNDGFTDIVVANNLSNEITILLWNTTFNEWNSSTRGVGDQPSSVMIGDANNDGLDDIIVANFDNDSVSIFTWNNTELNWDPEIRQSVGNAPISVEVGDVNNDGLSEIVTANQLANTISILQWNELNQNWSIPISRAVGNSPSDLTIGDGNNDGELDILTANLVDNAIRILTWNVLSENWDSSVESVGISPTSIAVGDVNFDGQNDIVVTNYADANVSLLTWDILTKDWIPSTEPTEAGPTCVVIGDANNNGVPEIITSNRLTNSISIILWNTTQGNIAPKALTNADGFASEVAVGDANNDGEEDIVIATPGDNTVAFLSWNESLNDWNSLVEIDAGIEPTTVDIGDANNDGAQDIVVSSTVSFSYVSIIIWNQTINSWNPYILKNITNFRIEDVIIADVNNDGANDILSIIKDQVRLSILLWNKTETDWDSVIHRFPTSIPEHAVVGDINNDGFNDIVAAGNNSNYAYVFTFLWNSSDNNWESCKTLTVSKPLSIFTPGIAIGDADNDGQNELVVTDKNLNNVSILSWNNTAQTWDPPSYRLVQPGPVSVAIGDANNDGHNDIATSNVDSILSVSALYWNSTNQDWDTQNSYDGGVDPYSIIIADLNDNGENDIIVANPSSAQISILEFNRFPIILSPAEIQANPLWTQDEDFGSFLINLTEYELDIDDTNEDLDWYTSDLNATLVTVSNEFSTDNILNFSSVPNMSGTDTFEIILKDAKNFLDSVLITITINPINDKPTILTKEDLQQYSKWKQTPNVNSFTIDLSPYESDIEDVGSDLDWFIDGLDPQIATVEDENASDDVLTFHIVGRGSDTFTLYLIDSEGATDNVTITLRVESLIPLIIRLTIIIGSIVAAGIIAVVLYLNRRKRPTQKELSRKPITPGKTEILMKY